MLVQSSSLLLKICGHLLRCCAQINPQRIKDTPAVNLCSRLVSTPPIFKRLTQKGFSEAARLPLVPRGSDVFESQKLVVQKCTWKYIFEHACGCFLYAPSIYLVYLYKANGKKAFLTGIARLKSDYIYLIFVSVKNLRKRGFNYG